VWQPCHVHPFYTGGWAAYDCASRGASPPEIPRHNVLWVEMLCLSAMVHAAAAWRGARGADSPPFSPSHSLTCVAVNLAVCTHCTVHRITYMIYVSLLLQHCTCTATIPGADKALEKRNNTIKVDYRMTLQKISVQHLALQPYAALLNRPQPSLQCLVYGQRRYH